MTLDLITEKSSNIDTIVDEWDKVETIILKDVKKLAYNKHHESGSKAGLGAFLGGAGGLTLAIASRNAHLAHWGLIGGSAVGGMIGHLISKSSQREAAEKTAKYITSVIDMLKQNYMDCRQHGESSGYCQTSVLDAAERYFGVDTRPPKEIITHHTGGEVVYKYGGDHGGSGVEYKRYF